VPCRLGTWVRSLTQHDDRVSVTFSDGSSGIYDLVVVADGISSTVRSLALGTTPPAYTGAMAWRSVAPVRPRGLTGLQFLFGEGCFFGLCPVGDGRIYGFGNITEPRAHEPPAGRLDRLRRRFAGFAGIVQDYLAALSYDEEIHCGPVDWVALVQWHRGRVVLIGDAAHASSPMMGQDGSMAMEDACVLAESLRRDTTVAEALASVARRRQRVSWCIRKAFGSPLPCATPLCGSMAIKCCSAASRRSLRPPSWYQATRRSGGSVASRRERPSRNMLREVPLVPAHLRSVCRARWRQAAQPASCHAAGDSREHIRFGSWAERFAVSESRPEFIRVRS